MVFVGFLLSMHGKSTIRSLLLSPSVISTACPESSQHMTALESPTWATTVTLGYTRATVAVVPLSSSAAAVAATAAGALPSGERPFENCTVSIRPPSTRPTVPAGVIYAPSPLRLSLLCCCRFSTTCRKSVWVLRNASRTARSIRALRSKCSRSSWWDRGAAFRKSSRLRWSAREANFAARVPQ